jgi:hypothetical protein
MIAKRLARRGKAAIVSALVSLVAIELLSCVAADYLEPGLRDPEYGRKLSLLQAQVSEAPDRPLLLLLGTSRTAYGLRPDAIFDSKLSDPPLIYNFGILGGGPVFELLCFRRLLAANIHPRWVVVEVHPALLKSTPSLMGAHVPPMERCDARDLVALDDYLDDLPAVWGAWLHYRAAACYRFRGELVRRLAPHWLPEPAQPDYSGLDKTAPSGWTPGPWPRPDPAIRQVRANMVKGVYAAGYQDFEISDRPDRALREILETCRREHIGAALLLMPEAEELRDASATLAQAEIRRYLAELGNQYGAAVCDASRWCDDADFSDGQHLLAEAATRLSSRLGSQMLGTWIASSSRRNGVPTVATGRPSGVKR